MKGTLRKGSSTGDPEKYVKQGCFYRGIVFWGIWRGASFLGPSYFEKFYMRFSRNMQMSCKRVSLSTGVLLGNLEGINLPGVLREKN
jgi:hypothetical protein